MPPTLHLPVWPFWVAGAACEAICAPFGIEPPLYRRRVDFFTKSRAFDITRARGELGYAPQVSLRKASGGRWSGIEALDGSELFATGGFGGIAGCGATVGSAGRESSTRSKDRSRDPASRVCLPGRTRGRSGRPRPCAP